MAKSVYIISLLFSSFLLMASEINEEGKTPFEYTGLVQQKIKELKNVDADEYEKATRSIRIEVDKFIELKKRVCDGEFSTIILKNSQSSSEIGSSQPEASKPNKKLNREERKLCFRELKAMQESYINNLYYARKNYLLHLHSKQLKDLEKVKQNAIKKIKSRI